jgi:hypothetical protein
MMKKGQRKQMIRGITIVGLVIFVVLSAWLLVSAKDEGSVTYNLINTQILRRNRPPEIQKSSDLDTTLTELDNTNVDILDTDLKQLETDASSF